MRGRFLRVSIFQTETQIRSWGHENSELLFKIVFPYHLYTIEGRTRQLKKIKSLGIGEKSARKTQTTNKTRHHKKKYNRNSTNALLLWAGSPQIYIPSVCTADNYLLLPSRTCCALWEFFFRSAFSPLSRCKQRWVVVLAPSLLLGRH